MVRTRPQHCMSQAWQNTPRHPRGKSRGMRNSRAADLQCNVIFLNLLSASGSLTNYSHWFLDLDFSCFPFSFPLSSSLCAFSGKPLLWIATEASVSRSQASPHLVRETSFGRWSSEPGLTALDFTSFLSLLHFSWGWARGWGPLLPTPPASSFPPSHYLFPCLLIRPTAHIKITGQPIKKKMPVASNEGFLALLELTCILILKSIKIWHFWSRKKFSMNKKYPRKIKNRL